MSLKSVLAVIARMQADGVIHRYAIGGAVGATFYLEPVATLDLDVFVALAPEAGRSLVSLEPIYRYLTDHGAALQGEYVVIEDWPVRFLAGGTPLVGEALDQAIAFEVGGESVEVFSAEHLAAIALEVGRPKDSARLLQFIEAGVLDRARFEAILERHGLALRWERFAAQFLGGGS